MANRRTFTVESIDEGQRLVRVIASTADPVKGFDDKGNARQESLRGWKLDRFMANPAVLWNHEQGKHAIGSATEVRDTERGLEMTLQLAAANERNELAEQTWDSIKAGRTRGVSVGFDYGARSDEGEVAVFTGNELHEVSFVSVPADAGALVNDPPAVSDEERQRKTVSDAGRALRMARKTRIDANETFQRFDQVGRAGRVRRTQVGGIRVDARLTRTGVLTYVLPDGSVRRELRHPDEVFNADSLATLQSAPVTSIEHHRALIDARNWKEAALGHTENVRSDSRYVEGELVINDGDAATKVESGALADISCGYECKLDFTPGEFEGERYDAIQRAIRYNHVAVLPKGRGRAGTDVGIRLDSTDALCIEDQPDMKTIRLDGKDFEVGSDAHLAKLDEIHAAALTKFKADAAEDKTALQKKLDETTANFDAAAKAKKKLEEELEEEKGEKGKARIRSRLRLLQRTAKFLTDDDEEEKDEDKKFDSLEALSDRELMVKVINSDANWKEEKFDGKSDDYIQALFDSVTKNFTRADGVDSIVAAHKVIARSDAADDIVSKAEAAMKKRNAEAFTKPLAATKDQARG